MRKKLIKLASLFLLINLYLLPSTGAYLTDRENVSGQFKAGTWEVTHYPVVNIHSVSDGDTVSSTLEIVASITDPDNDLSHYWLVVQNSLGQIVAGPGVVTQHSQIQNQLIFTWNTSSFVDGSYVIKLEARDLAGHKEPNQAPVLADANINTDSVDWVELMVDHTIDDLVINEVYYDVASDQNENLNEWVELYNNSDETVNLLGWKLVDKAGNARNISTDTDLPSHGFALLSYPSHNWDLWTEPSSAILANLTDSGAWLNNSGEEYLRLFNPSNQEADFVAWGGYDGWTINSGEGKSIARATAGVDTNAVADWAILASPNPGTNPHSHILVNLKQIEQNLQISFSNATGFDEVKYVVSYEHDAIKEQVIGVGNKVIDQENLALSPVYFGTCSSGGACTAHANVNNVNISLLYQKSGQVLGQSEINFNWFND